MNNGELNLQRPISLISTNLWIEKVIFHIYVRKKPLNVTNEGILYYEYINS